MAGTQQSMCDGVAEGVRGQAGEQRVCRGQGRVESRPAQVGVEGGVDDRARAQPINGYASAEQTCSAHVGNRSIEASCISAAGLAAASCTFTLASARTGARATNAAPAGGQADCTQQRSTWRGVAWRGRSACVRGESVRVRVRMFVWAETQCT